MSLHDKTQVAPNAKIEPTIYAWSDPANPSYAGWLKIGYTERQTAEQRVKQSVGQTLVKPKMEWTYPARFLRGGHFKDHDFHRYLLRKHKIMRQKGTEWFDFNPEGAPKSEELIREFLLGNSQTALATFYDYKLREEQAEAVGQTVGFFQLQPKSEYLWNAKPRFGKTLTTYALIEQLSPDKDLKVLIVTNRPAIANSWYQDYEQFIKAKSDYLFVSETSSLAHTEALTPQEYGEEMMKRKNAGRKTGRIEFLSLQDLKGSRYFGGTFNKLKHIADIQWDILVIDEAHEGVDTFKTDIAFDNIKRNHTLHLSGTPFKALANNKFSQDQIYNWSYEDEQTAKANWDKESANPYENLPSLSLFTYQLSSMIVEKVNQGADLGETNGLDYTFDLNEFFDTDDKGNFKYESDIKKFLDRLTTNEKFPFSTPGLRSELRHTFWLLNRVASAQALEKMLKTHPVFENYHIVMAVGKQDDNEKAYDKVKNAIITHEKTITLSVGQLTTGVTIPEWTAVMMLSNLKSPSLYMQAAFRAQNPWTYETQNGAIYQKETAYIFDFAPERTLQIFDEFANNLNSRKNNTTNDREENIKQLLNFFPVIAEDEDGKMMELDATQVLTIPNTLKAHEVVRRGFMSNLLFDNISGIFAYPKQLMDILEKLPEEKEGKAVPATKPLEVPQDIQVDEAGNAEPEKEWVINTTEAVFGAKVYAPKAEDIKKIQESLAKELPKKQVEKIAETFAKNATNTVFTPQVIKDLSGTVGNAITAHQQKNIIRQAETTIKEVAKKEAMILEIEKSHIEENFNQKIAEALVPEAKAELLDQMQEEIAEATTAFAQKLTEKVTETIEAQKEEIVHAQVQKKEQKKANTAMEDVRSRLRGFARTIPSFIMAYGDRDLTLANFDHYVNATAFEELTGISITQFKQLRDGMVINDDKGNAVEVKGLFDAPTFDTAIEEFLNKKEALANYFDPKLTEDIFDYIPPQKTNQIFTPKRIVKMMLDLMEKEDPQIFANPNVKFVDLYTKSGLYLAELVKRLFVGIEGAIPDKNARLRHILNHQVFGLAPTEIIAKIAQNYVYGFAGERQQGKNIRQLDLVPLVKAGNEVAKQKVEEWFGMKFDVVIGNPPYQEENVGKNNQSNPLYHLFYDLAEVISKKYCLITPARFLSNQGATPKVWNKKMLSDERIKIAYFNSRSTEIFPNIDIKGGIVVLYRDANQFFEPIDTFIPYEHLRRVYHKVRQNTDRYLSSLVFSPDSYRFSEKMFEENPNLIGRTDDSHAKAIASSVFERYPEVFTESLPDDNEFVQIYGRINGVRAFRFIKRKYIASHKNLDKWKVFVPGANGSGAFGEVISLPIIGNPQIGHNQTFVSLGEFDRKCEAEALLRYIKTKFSRAMLGIMKTTHNNQSKGTWSKVPLQDFTPQSDIDWSKSIPEIDQQLYRKYGLDESEIVFIEEKVKAME
ncbi:MAG: Eco57I restriction-modification methylase domain-containing protein [Turicibacter sp.]|nr:Eco57I restriction-modification methylase domain-containing protein [Turicibacter sp.]